jgi:acyl-coenzyme A thioesterase PaaI-like protein
MAVTSGLGANPIEQPSRGVDVGMTGNARNQPHEGAHGANAATAIDTAFGVTLEAATGAGAEVSLDIVREVVL